MNAPIVTLQPDPAKFLGGSGHGSRHGREPVEDARRAGGWRNRTVRPTRTPTQREKRLARGRSGAVHHRHEIDKLRAGCHEVQLDPLQ